MKTRISLVMILGITLILNVSVSKAQSIDTDKIRMIVLEDNKVLIESDIASVNNATLEITDLGRFNSVYNEEIAFFDNKQQTVVDLGKLPQGNYLLQLNLGNYILEREVNLYNGQSEIVMRSEYAVPEFSKSGNTLNISFTQSPVGQGIIVTFMKGSSEFFIDEIQADIPFSQPYNLQNLNSGEYHVKVETPERTFGYFFDVL